MITTYKIRYNIGEYLWNYWQNNNDIESIRNAEKTLKREIEIGLRRRFKDFCEYQLLCNLSGRQMAYVAVKMAAQKEFGFNECMKEFEIA